MISATKARQLATTASGKLLLEDFKIIEREIEAAALRGEFQLLYHCQSQDFGQIIEVLKEAGYEVTSYIKGLIIEW